IGLGFDQRVDLQHVAVARHEGGVELFRQLLALLVEIAFMASDCDMLEINPLVETKPDADGKASLLVLDTKMSFDGNALYRHPAIEAMRDETEEDPAEVEASEYDLAYIKLDGNIGCMVNGAGLAMATMDIIKLNGAFPANFLDVGGGATTEKVTAAFKIILKDPAVEGILVNIFGGIMKCDIIANGVVQAAKDLDLQVPLVVRLEGTNVEAGKEILSNSGLAIVPADDLGDAAKKIVAEVKKAA
ncbi:MAG: succinate--CoA ligase subunit beta, partial [Pseudomonadota bacterium]